MVRADLETVAVYKDLLDNVGIGEVLNDAGQIMGAASFRRNGVFLSVKNLSKTSKAHMGRFVLGHEGLHHLEAMYKSGLLDRYNQTRMDNWSKFGDAISFDERVLIWHDVLAALPADQRKAIRDTITDEIVVTEPAEFRANVGAALTLLMTGSKQRSRVQQLLTHLPKPVSDFVTTLLQHFRKMFGAMRQWGRFGQHKMVDPLPPELRQSLEEFSTQLKAMAKTEKEMNRDIERMMALEQMEPPGFINAQRQARTSPAHHIEFGDSSGAGWADDIQLSMRKAMGLNRDERSLLRRTGRKILNVIESLHQHAETNPEFRDMIHITSTSKGAEHEAIGALHRGYMTKLADNGVDVITDLPNFKHLTSITDPGPTQEAYSNLARLIQDSEAMPDFNSPEVKAILDPLPRRAQLDVKHGIDTVLKQMQELWTMVEDMRTADSHMMVGTSILARQPEVGIQDAKKAGEILWHRQREIEKGNDLLVKAMEQQLVDYGISPEVLAGAEKFTQNLQNGLDQLMTHLRSRPWFMSEMHFGRHKIEFQIAGSKRKGRVSADTRKQAEAKYRQAVQGKQVVAGSKRHVEPGREESLGFPPEMLPAIRQIDEQTKAHLKEAIGSEPGSENVINLIDQLVDTASQLEAQTALGDIRSRGERTLTDGRETINMFSNQIRFQNAVVASETRRYVRTMQGLHNVDPVLKQDPETLQRVNDHIAQFLEADTVIGSTLAKANFAYYLGMSLGSHFLEGTQSVFSLVPNLIEAGAGIGESYGLLRRAAGQAIRVGFGKTKGIEDLKDPDLQKFMKEMVDKGHVDNLGAFSDVDPRTMNHIWTRQLGQERKPFEPTDIVKKPISHFAAFSGRFYSMFTHFNARVALLSGFEYARRQVQGKAKSQLSEKDYAEARDFAVQLNLRSNMSGGRTARPTGLYGNEFLGRTGSQIMGSLTSYSFGMVSMYARMIKKSFQGNRSAQKAAVVMLGTQLAAAGALGLPFVGAMLTLLEKMFPDMELRKELKVSLADAISDDDQMGGIWADVAMKGMGQMLPSGPDVGSRFALGNVLGTSSYDGFSMENLIGPTFNLFSSVAIGASQIAGGEPLRGLETALPLAFKKPIHLYRNDGEVRDSAGRTLANNLSFGEQVAFAAGFTPTQASKLRDTYRLVSRANQVAQHKDSILWKEVAQLYKDGRANEAREKLLSAIREDPTKTLPQSARSVAKVVEKQEFPIDPRHLATTRTAPSVTELLAHTQGIGDASEMQRLLLRKQVEGTLGVPSQARPLRTQLRKAAMIDQLLAQNPFLSRISARERLGL